MICRLPGALAALALFGLGPSCAPQASAGRVDSLSRQVSALARQVERQGQALEDLSAQMAILARRAPRPEASPSQAPHTTSPRETPAKPAAPPETPPATAEAPAPAPDPANEKARRALPVVKLRPSDDGRPMRSGEASPPASPSGGPRVLRLTGAPAPANTSQPGGDPVPASPLPSTGDRIPYAPLPDGPKVAPDSQGATQEYQAAWRLRQRQRYEEAARAFSVFARKHPNHDLAQSALLWLGDTLLIQRQAKEAAWVLRQLLAKHPGGKTAPAALLKLAACEMRLGRQNEAVRVLSQIVKRHPKSAEAQEAAKRLQRLR